MGRACCISPSTCCWMCCCTCRLDSCTVPVVVCIADNCFLTSMPTTANTSTKPANPPTPPNPLLPSPPPPIVRACPCSLPGQRSPLPVTVKAKTATLGGHGPRQPLALASARRGPCIWSQQHDVVLLLPHRAFGL